MGGKTERGYLTQLLTRLDVESMYGSGGKSLVGGRKGKPSGLSDKTIRIDRQGLGNVQFQIGDDSYACVTFQQTADPQDIIAGLWQSFNSGQNVDL